MKTIIADGNTVVAKTSYIFTENAGIYPITPSSTMAELTDVYSSQNVLNAFKNPVTVTEMQSEAGAAALVHGSLKNGSLTTTYTASQGLLLMIPNMYKIAGEMLPGVIHVAARSLSTHSLSILGDHQDVYATLQTGFNFLASSSVQDTTYMTAISHLVAIHSNLPFLHFFDGFRTSHELNKVNVLETSDVKHLINQEGLNNFKSKAINLNHPQTSGTNQNDDIYFQATEVRNKDYEQIPDLVNEYMQKINAIANTNYKPFTYYGNKEAKTIILAMGSVTETIKEVVGDLTEYGVITVHLFRPFSSTYLKNIIPKTTQNIIVLDRAKDPTSREQLYLSTLNALKDTSIKVTGGIFGISSKNTTPAQIKAVFETTKDDFTIGIEDDITHKSLPIPNYTISKHQEMLFYGYGSDGMISASKSIIKMLGEKNYVQGYFQYDSKKSGGVTKSHLRISNEIIRSTYYVSNPSLVVITKESYLNTFNCLSEINQNATLIINTAKNEEELNKCLSNNNKYLLITKNIKVYTINALEISRKCGLKNKISTIMQTAILDFQNHDYTNNIKQDIENRFQRKGEEIVQNNIRSIDLVKDYIKQVNITGNYTYVEEKTKDIYDAINKREGDKLKVSAFESVKNGAFKANTSKDEKRKISDLVPKWIKENCIKCNQCAFVCPHSVIRPFELNEEEISNAPENIRKNLLDNYILSISVDDCTGCGLCIKSCLSKQKSLLFEQLNTQIKEQENYNYLSNNITCKNTSCSNVKNTQFKQPKFEFSGACAGCGETPYIKLLTQMVDNLVIANATGCSSIYGASVPSSPYNVPWSSSLFEDNAEFGYGMYLSDKHKKQAIKNILNKYNIEYDMINYEETKKLSETIEYDKYPELIAYKQHIITKSFWCIGGDGWAYDIGFSGIDHIMSTNDNINILVLDTEIYSNTGGQASKSTPIGSIAQFAANGKSNTKKDLAKMMMGYSNAYVAQVSISNPVSLIKAFKEANEHQGPSLIIAYSSCISHGIEGGMENSVEMAKLAVNSGYFPIFRSHPINGFRLDSKPNFDLYEEFLLKQNRYKMLKSVCADFDVLLSENKNFAMKRFEYYSSLEK